MSGRGHPCEPPVRTARPGGAWALAGSLCFLAAMGNALPADAPSPALDIDSAIHLALENNRALALRALSTERADLGLAQAQQAFALSVRPRAQLAANDEGAEGGYGLALRRKFKPGTEILIDGGATRLPAFIDDDWRSSVRIELRQPLFGGFGELIHGEPSTAAGERLLSEQRQWELQKSDLVIDVVRAFETIVRLQRQLEADAAVLKRTEKLVELTKARQIQGRATRVDSLRADMQLGETRARLESHREELYSTRRTLNELLGADLETEMALTPSPLLDIPFPDPTAAVQIALSNRMDFAQVLQEAHAAQRGTKIAGRRRLPDVDLVGRHEQAGTGGDFDTSTRLDESRWLVGLESDYELNRTSDRLAIRTAALDADAASESVRIKVLSITREVQQALSTLRLTSNNLTTAARNYELAAARAELARALFEIGRGDSFAATDAEEALIGAELHLLQARADRAISAHALLRATGTLIDHPGHLKPEAAQKG